MFQRNHWNTAFLEVLPFDALHDAAIGTAGDKRRNDPAGLGLLNQLLNANAAQSCRCSSAFSQLAFELRVKEVVGYRLQRRNIFAKIRGAVYDPPQDHAMSLLDNLEQLGATRHTASKHQRDVVSHLRSFCRRL